jgi:hypothetical protein
VMVPLRFSLSIIRFLNTLDIPKPDIIIQSTIKRVYWTLVVPTGHHAGVFCFWHRPDMLFEIPRSATVGLSKPVASCDRFS